MTNSDFNLSSYGSTSTEDLELFNDLVWEREMKEERRKAGAGRHQAINLSARIEDYLKSYI